MMSGITCTIYLGVLDANTQCLAAPGIGQDSSNQGKAFNTAFISCNEIKKHKHVFLLVTK